MYVPLVNEFRNPPFSYQNRSPILRFLKVDAIIQVNNGPIILPGAGSSETPADHKSISSGYLDLQRFLSKCHNIKKKTM